MHSPNYTLLPIFSLQNRHSYLCLLNPFRCLDFVDSLWFLCRFLRKILVTVYIIAFDQAMRSRYNLKSTIMPLNLYIFKGNHLHTSRADSFLARPAASSSSPITLTPSNTLYSKGPLVRTCKGEPWKLYCLNPKLRCFIENSVCLRGQDHEFDFIF